MKKHEYYKALRELELYKSVDSNDYYLEPNRH